MAKLTSKKWLYGLTAALIYVMAVNALLYFERDAPDASIGSLWDALWYSVVTLTTVGYGDLYPVSTAGRLIGYVFVLASVGLVGVLISTITEVLLSMREVRRMGHNGTKFVKHVVVIGWDSFAQSVVDNLTGADKKVAIIVDDKNWVDAIYERYGSAKVFVLVTDYTNYDSFRKANIEESTAIFLNFAEDTRKLVHSLNLKKRYKDIEHVVVIESSELQDTFRSAGITYTLSKNEIASKIVASFIFEPDVAQFSVGLLTSAVRAEDHDIQQFLVTKDNPYCGKPYLEAFTGLKTSHNVILIGIAKEQPDGSRKLFKNPDGDTRINEGDYLILIMSGEQEKPIRTLFGVEEGLARFSR